MEAKVVACIHTHYSHYRVEDSGLPFLSVTKKTPFADAHQVQLSSEEPPAYVFVIVGSIARTAFVLPKVGKKFQFLAPDRKSFVRTSLVERATVKGEA